MSLRIAHLHAENVKRLTVVEVTPEGNIVEVAGDNGEGKTSLLDSIWIALKGRAVAPPELIRQGEEHALIEMDLGKLRIVRTFKRTEDGDDYTDTLAVTDAEGLKYPKPQAVLDALVGALGFDPFAFVQMKPDAQAKALLGLVSLTDAAGQPVDLAELAAQDKRLDDTRRDVNRDLKNAEARLSSLPVGEKVPHIPLDELQAKLTNASEHNASIERRKHNRETFQTQLAQDSERLQEDRDRIAALIKLADDLEADIAARQKQVDEAEPLPEPVDVAELSRLLSEARQLADKNRELEMRDVVKAEVAELQAKSDSYTKRMEDNAKLRLDALARANMPIEGLGVDYDDDGAHVTFNAVPFVQISKAEQIRVATAIAMAANPELRVLRVSDGALLDDKSMSILAEMAEKHDFQLWIELVRPNEATGIILENGAIVGQDAKPRERKKPQAKKAEEKRAEAETHDALNAGAELDAPREPKASPLSTMTKEEWDALTPARRAYLSRTGQGGFVADGNRTEGDDDNAR
jgi:hypothetical protein